MKKRSGSRTRKIRRPTAKSCDLSLYIIDGTYRSVTASANLSRICHEQLGDRCRVAVIDIEKSPELAKENQIVAIPTLIKTFPLPMRRVIGDLSDTGRVLAGLDLHAVH